NSDNITKDNTPSFSGTAEPGVSVDLMEGTTVLGTAFADGSGVWHIISSVLADGTHNLVARSTDQAGNTSFSGPLTVNIDTANPAANAGADQTKNENDSVTLTGSFTDTGGFGPYAEHWHFVSSTNGQVVPDADGSTLNFTALDNGTYVFEYSVTDAAGNTGAD